MVKAETATNCVIPMFSWGKIVGLGVFCLGKAGGLVKICGEALVASLGKCIA